MLSEGIEEESIRALLTNLERGRASTDLSQQNRAMLEYALKLTRTPGEMAEEDVRSLRDHGFDDRAIHDICAVTAYFAFVNRIADGLGVELEVPAPTPESNRSRGDS